MITAESNLGALLDAHPELVELLAGYHAQFARLRHRRLRRVMAPRVTVGQAAAIAGLPAMEVVAALRRALGEQGDTTPAATTAPVGEASPRPSELDAREVVEVDVRDDLRRGEEPFARIMAVVKTLGADQALVVRAPFEPVPLYDVLGRRGLAHWTERLADADWRIWFYRGGPAAPEASPAPEADALAAGSTLDVRGLEPPQPMVRVLERLDTLRPGDTLTVLHERRPMFLYPQLDARGFRHETDETEAGVVRIVIRRPAA